LGMRTSVVGMSDSRSEIKGTTIHDITVRAFEYPPLKGAIHAIQAPILTVGPPRTGW